MKCCAFGCKNRSEFGFLLKRFPADLKKKESWVKNMRRKDWQPTQNSRLCEVHFTDDQWEKKRQDGSHKLKCSAIPTLFIYNTCNLKEKKPKNRDPWQATASQQSTADVTNVPHEGRLLQSTMKNKVVKKHNNHSLSNMKTILKNKKIHKSEKKILKALKKSSQLNLAECSMKNRKIIKNDARRTTLDDFVFSPKPLIETVNTVEDLSTICRLCLNVITQELSVPIWGDKQNYSKRIFKCCTIACSNNSQFKDFPKRLCINCVTKLDDAYHFRTMCLESNEKLNKIYTNLMANKLRPRKVKELDKDDNVRDDAKEDFILIQPEEVCLSQEKSTDMKSHNDSESFDEKYNDANSIDDVADNNAESDDNDNDNDDDSNCIHDSLAKYSSWKYDINSDEGVQIYNCQHCPMVCHTPAELHFHKKSHEKTYSETDVVTKTAKSPRNIYCQVEGCNATFVKFDERIKHAIECHKDSQFTGHKDICPYCAKVISNSFNIRYAMRKHIHLMHSSTSVCPICGKICGSARLTSHIAAIHKRKYEKCPTCGLNMTAKSLYVHMRAVHMKILNYACHLCDKKFYTNYSLQVHIRRHTGNRPFQCPDCDRAFAQRHLMNKHILNVHKLGILPKRKGPSSSTVTSKPKKGNKKVKTNDGPFISS